jgi:hypothetical protein
VNESADRALAVNVKQPEATDVDHGMRIKDRTLPIADCQLPIERSAADSSYKSAIGNRKLAIG